MLCFFLLTLLRQLQFTELPLAPGEAHSMGSRCFVGIFWVYCVLVLSTGTATASESGSVANDVTCPALLDTMQALVDAAVGARTRGQFNVAARCLQDAIDQVSTPLHTTILA